MGICIASVCLTSLMANYMKCVTGFVMKVNFVWLAEAIIMEVQLGQFTIGNIDMSQQNIWITFDERITDIILGMDILKQIIMITNPYNQQVYFCKDSDDYNSSFKLLNA